MSLISTLAELVARLKPGGRAALDRRSLALERTGDMTLPMTDPVSRRGFMQTMIAFGRSGGGGNTTIVQGEAERTFDSRAELMAANIQPPVKAVRTNGYATAGDGGAALWARAAAAPAHGASVQSADGAWWELAPENGTVHMSALGMTGGDSVADTSAQLALTGWLATMAIANGGSSTTPVGTAIKRVIYPQTSVPIVLDWRGVPYNDRLFLNVRGLAIDCRGARVTVASGMKCGYSSGNLTADEEAHGFLFENCADIEVDGLDFDGNLANLDTGPFDGRGIAIGFYKVHRGTIRDCSIRNCGTDGLFFWSRVANDPSRCEDIEIINTTSRDNRRQGASLVSVKGLVGRNCHFIGNGAMLQGINPKAGVDYEPSFPVDIVEDIHWTKCSFVGNGNNDIVADSAVTQIQRIVHEGCTAGKIWAKVESALWTGGSINGQIVNWYGTIRECHDINLSDQTIGASSLISNPNAAPIRIEDCSIRFDLTDNGSGNILAMNLSNSGRKVLKNVEIEISNTDQNSGTNIGTLGNNGGGGIYENVVVTEAGTTKPVFITTAPDSSNEYRNVRVSGDISFEGVGGRQFYDDAGGWVEYAGTTNPFRPNAKRLRLTGPTPSFTAFNVNETAEFWVWADGTTVTFSGGNVLLPDGTVGSTTLAPGERAKFVAVTNTRIQRLTEVA